jgi:MFS family permease
VSAAGTGTTAFYAAFFVSAWVRRIITYLAVVYGLEVLGGGEWSGLFYLCLVLPYSLSPYAGSVIDSSSNRAVLHVTSALGLVLFAVLAVATLPAWFGGGPAQGWIVAALIAAYGIVSAFNYPAFLAAVPEVFPAHRIVPATATINVLGMLCHACGPLAVGALRTAFDWPEIFAVVAALASVAWLLLVPVPLRAAHERRSSAMSEWHRMAELWAHCRRDPLLMGLLIAVALFATLLIGPLEVLAPPFAQQVLGGTAMSAGIFLATGGAGLLVGAIGGFALLRRSHVGTWLCGCGVLGPALVLAMTWLPSVAAWPLFFTAGALGGVFSSLGIAGIQACAPDALRGRVLGLFTLLLGALPAVGGFIAGVLLGRLGLSTTLRLAFATVAVAFALLYCFTPALRRAVLPGSSGR